jgi:tungstate transport system substrate-binding protein
MRSITRRCLAALLALLLPAIAVAQDNSIVVASTTSTEDSGLFKHILPLFKARTGIDVKMVAQGTGQALDTARRGDADVVFVHAKSAEEAFLAQGFGVKRYPVMYNDFILVGPKKDPAGVAGTKDIVAALKALHDKQITFVSRGDRSGTHIAELALWKLAGVDVGPKAGAWYKSIGQGMGAALNTAVALDAYVLTDRGTWLAFGNKGDLAIAGQGDKHLFNQYGIMVVNPEKHPHVKAAAGQRFIDWLVSPEGQRAIADYHINGEQLFFPNAGDPSA